MAVISNNPPAQQLRPALALTPGPSDANPTVWAAWVQGSSGTPLPPGVPAVGSSPSVNVSFTGYTTTASPDLAAFTLSGTTYLAVAWTSATTSAVQVATLQVGSSPPSLTQAQAPVSASPSGAVATGGPALAWYQGQLVVAYRDATSGNLQVTAVTPGTGGTLPAFPAPTAVTASGTSAPSLAALGGGTPTLFLAWTDSGTMGLMQATNSPPTTFSTSTWTLQNGSSGTPTILGSNHPVLGTFGSNLVATLVTSSSAATSYLCTGVTPSVQSPPDDPGPDEDDRWTGNTLPTQPATWDVSAIGGCTMNSLGSGSGQTGGGTEAAGGGSGTANPPTIIAVYVDSNGNVKSNTLPVPAWSSSN